MRPLSPLELRGLVHMSANPDYEVGDDDPIEAALNACVERGLASYTRSADAALDREEWAINDLGRLALRVYHAAQRSTP
jgi:hypothetical protein